MDSGRGPPKPALEFGVRALESGVPAMESVRALDSGVRRRGETRAAGGLQTQGQHLQVDSRAGGGGPESRVGDDAESMVRSGDLRQG